MKAWPRRFGDWTGRSDLTARDLAVFRILYALVTIVFLPNYLWIARFDPAFHRPPPGPFAVLPSFPPAWFLAGLDVLIAAALALLLVGWRTRPVSVLLGLALLVADGFAYSLGKIDHAILLALTPLFLGLAGWGEAMSLDARRRPHRPGAARPWAMRAFAVTIGLAFVTAAVVKVRGGWLDPTSQAVWGHVVQRTERGRTAWAAPLVAQVRAAPVREVLDWATVLFEAGLILAALSWRTWRLGLCAAVAFHLAVLLTLDIDFWTNVVAYGAFVLWWPLAARVPGLGAVAARLGRAATPALVAGAGALAAVFFVITHSGTPLTETLGRLPVLLALPVAGGYLVTRAGRRLRPARARTGPAVRTAGSPPAPG